MLYYFIASTSNVPGTFVVMVLSTSEQKIVEKQNILLEWQLLMKYNAYDFRDHIRNVNPWTKSQQGLESEFVSPFLTSQMIRLASILSWSSLMCLSEHLHFILQWKHCSKILITSLEVEMQSNSQFLFSPNKYQWEPAFKRALQY